MKLKTQLVISMVVFGLALLIIAVSVITTNQQVDRLNNQETIANNIELQVSELSYLSNDYLLYDEGQQVDRWDSKFSSISDDVSNLSVDTPDQQVLVNNIKESQQRLKDVFNDVVAHAAAENQSQDNTINKAFIQVSWSRIGVQIEGMVFDASRLSQKLGDEADQQKQINNLLISALLGIFAIFLLTNYLLIYRSTIKSITNLQAGTKIIGAGNLDFTIEEKKGNEFFELSHAFNQMTAQLKTITTSKADLEKEVTERKRAEIELQQKQEELESQAEELQSQAEELSANNEELGKQITERRHAEDVLQTTMQRFYTILSGMYASILLVSEDDRVEFANQAFCDYFGLKGSPSDLMGLAAPDMIEKIRNAYLYPDKAVAHISEIVSREQPVKGEEVSMQGGRTCLRDFIPLKVHGNPYGRLWLHMDISERKRAEEALQESENRYRTLFSGMTEGFALHEIVCDDKGVPVDYRFIDINPAFERLTGLKKESVVGKLVSVVLPDNDPYWVETYGAVALTGEPVHFDNYSSTLNKYYEVFAYRPAPCQFAVIFLDVTEPKKAEKVLRETRDYLESLINYANAPIIVWGNDFKITRFNHAFEHLTGYNSDEVVGKELDLLFPQESKDGSLDKIKRTLAGEYWESVEIPILRKDGKTRIALWNSANIYGEDGKSLMATIAQGQDITERKLAEKELLEAKMQAELYLDLMGHDISNMHQIAIGQLELAKDIINTDSKLEAADGGIIDVSLESLWRSAGLIDNVRKLQKIRSDDVKNKEINLNDLLIDITKQYDRQYPKKVIKIDSSERSHVVKVNELIRDVFTNLIGNAIKHSSGSELDISVKLEDVRDHSKKYHMVSIEDNGPGIPDDMKDKIFNRLQRGETKSRGMGLGLYLVRSLVESYHGKVWVEDRIQGDHTKGSRFVVILPAIED